MLDSGASFQSQSSRPLRLEAIPLLRRDAPEINRLLHQCHIPMAGL
jgi:hypothetical protein